jgi:hypothetical protein
MLKHQVFIYNECFIKMSKITFDKKRKIVNID